MGNGATGGSGFTRAAHRHVSRRQIWIDWYEGPARVSSTPEGTTFQNSLGETFTLTRTGVRVHTREGTASCEWARLQSLYIKFPEYPRFLAWYAAVVRGSLAGSPRAETVLEFSPAFPGFTWIIDVSFGSPQRIWNPASRQFFAALSDILPPKAEIQNPDLLDAYRRFLGVSFFARIWRSESILRNCLWPPD